MRLNPESMARASGRRPWWTIGAWVVVIVAMAMVSARFLGGVLTDEVKLTNRPESVKAQEVIDAQFGGRVVKDTEFLVVSSDTRPWGPQVAAFVTELKGQVEALGPEDVAGPVTTYADAVAMRSLLFTPDGHGMLLVLQLRGNPEPTIARIAQAVERAVPVMFQAQVLTPEQLAALAGEGAGSAPVQADPPEAYVLVSSDAAMTNNLQFLNAVQQIQVAVTRAGGRRLAAPPYSGYDAVQQADTLISPDRYTTLVAVPIVELSEDIVADLREVAGRADDGTFRVQVAGSAAVFADMMQIGEEDMRKSESIGLLVALLVLVVVFGSIVAAVLPLIMGLFAIAVALGLVALVGQIWGFNMFVENMVTMIGLAVGIDYSLFIVSRYREERKKGFEKLEAIRRSGATASRAVFFSGATVVLALLGMLIVPVSIFRSLAGGAILVTIAAIAASMTLLPAILSLLGDRVNWPRLSRRARLETSHDPQGGFWDRVTRSVMRRPVVYLVASVLVLGSLAGFYLQLHRGTTQNISALPPEFPSRQAFITLVNEFHLGGVSDPVQVVLTGDVTRPEVREAVKALQWELGQQETFSNRSEVAQSKDGRAMLVSAYFSGDTMNDAAFDGIRTLRTDLIPRAFDGLDGVEVTVGGNTAGFTDFLDLVGRYQWIVVLFVLALSLILLTVVFRSVVVPIKALIMNLLSVGAAYGAVTLVFQKGWGIGFFNALGFPFERVEAIEAWLPLFLFSILFGLSMDYHVFLLTRIREEYDKTGDNTEAVAYGLRTTAGIITGAALIMVTVFGSFAAGRLSQFQQMGFGLAVAVLMDATIVRVLLVPASMRLLGDWNWYLPRWLRWLPELHVEGGQEPAGSREPAGGQVSEVTPAPRVIPAPGVIPAPEISPLPEAPKPREPAGGP